MTKTNGLKILGFVALALGGGVSLLNDWIADKTMDEKIDEKVNAAIAERNEEEES